MIVTVTPNPAVDRIVRINGFTLGAINRSVTERTDIGGKGINVARHLARMGCDVLATGFLGTGDLHDVVETLTAQGVLTDFVRVAGHTRVNLKILDHATGQETEINESGPSLGPGVVEPLLDKLNAVAPRSTVMVFSGSLPPGAPDDLYARAIALAAGAGIKTILDAAGFALRYGIAAKPDLVKPNRAEAEELLGVSLNSEAALIAGARQLLASGARAAVISLGAAGAVYASDAGVWRARAPQVKARNSVGSGDAMVAALASAMIRSLPPPDALRLAIALGSATAASDAPLPAAGRLEALLPEVVVELVAAGETPVDAASTAL
jgi:1-phosphofructokinase family hexose kinase